MKSHQHRLVSADAAVSNIKSGTNVFIQTAAAAPQQLVKAMTRRAGELRGVNIYHMHTEGEAHYADPGMQPSFRVNCFFIAANMRKAVQEGRASYIPTFLSEIPMLFRKGIIKIDVAMIHVSPPDVHGYCSLGVSVDVTPAVLETAGMVIAQVNPNMPRTHGAGFIHIDEIDYLVEVNEPIHEAVAEIPSPEDNRIADHVAALIEDGSTLQMGIGKIPNAVLSRLVNHKQLGIHTEMFSDGLIDLVISGAVTGELKKKHPRKIVSGFLLGTRRLYDFVHDNPMIQMLDIAYVNDTHVIRQNPKVCAINSALEVDLTGQVCADSVGRKLYSGVGGQMDFMRGAALSSGGKPIIAMNATTRDGSSKIVTSLKPGAGVTTTRAHVRYIVTEFGVADLMGKNLMQRAEALIAIAHPDHQSRLAKEALT